MTRQEMMEIADSNGIEYKKNISNDALSELIKDVDTEKVETPDVDAEVAKLAEEVEARNENLKAAVKEQKKPENKAASIGKTKADARKEASKLVRCIVTAMDKDKAELHGEIISCGNSMTGMVKKFVPFGKEWHIPKIIVDSLKEKKMWTTRDRKTVKGVVKENAEIPAYNVQELPDLTQEELDRITKEGK